MPDQECQDQDRSPTPRLVVALDCPSPGAAREMVATLIGIPCVFKIGYHLLLAAGSGQLIDHLLASGHEVFLDCKIRDIPSTVERAVAHAAGRGIHFITVHASQSCIQAAVRGRNKADHPRILAVGKLTSSITTSYSDVIALAGRAAEGGANGIVCAPKSYLGTLRAAAMDAGGQDFLIACPGIRPSKYLSDDHMNRATPAEAASYGADLVIVGRPILEAPDPAAMAVAIIKQMEMAADQVDQ